MNEKNQVYQSLNHPQFLIAGNRPVSIHRADTRGLKEEAYRLRYQVYCKHLGFEPEDEHPDQLEQDRYDQWSYHLLVRDEISGRYVGTMRLVSPNQGTQQALPLQNFYTEKQLLPAQERPSVWHSGQHIEYSRLAISPETATQYSKTYPIEVARLLYLSASAFFVSQPRLQHAHCFVEGRLARRLNIIGLPLERTAHYVEFKGQRAAYYFSKRNYENWFRGESKELFYALLQLEHWNTNSTRRAA
ncbi:MAG: GNAT family N-acetyltransferase [Pseudomonadales bacterium]|nr:GNAT family N-acetyltransferase [Pseudomonadales bacterium]